MRRPRHGSGADADTRNFQPPKSIAQGPDSADEALAEIRRFESAARTIADDRALPIRQKCKALLEMMAKARRSENAAFLETAIWRGCHHFFEGDEQVPRDVIEANRRLVRRGHDRCPECRRPLPSVADLDRWRQLGHDLRRPA
jgi:hypothetical protein